MGKRLCMSLACVSLAALISIGAAILANRASAAEKHKKHVKALFLKCEAGTSHDAYVLSLRALILLGIAHIVANLVVVYDACDAFTRKKAPACSNKTKFFLLFFWLSGSGGMFLLYKEMKSDNKSGGVNCHISLVHLTSYGWMCCTAHAVVSLVYFMVTLFSSTSEEEEKKKGDGRV